MFLIAFSSACLEIVYYLLVSVFLHEVDVDVVGTPHITNEFDSILVM